MTDPLSLRLSLRPHELPDKLPGHLGLGTPGPYPAVFVHAPLFLGADRFAAALPSPGIVDVPASGDLDEFRRRLGAPTGWAGAAPTVAGGQRVPIVVRGLHRGTEVLDAVLGETLARWAGAVPVMVTSALPPPEALRARFGTLIVAGTLGPDEFAVATGLDAVACDLAGGHLDAVRSGAEGPEPDPILVAEVDELAALFPAEVDLAIVVASAPGGIAVDDIPPALGHEAADLDELLTTASGLGLVRRDADRLHVPFAMLGEVLQSRRESDVTVSGAVRRLRAAGQEVDAAMLVAGDPQPMVAAERIRLGQLVHRLVAEGPDDDAQRLAAVLASRPEPSVARVGRTALVAVARSRTELDPSAEAAADADDRRHLPHVLAYAHTTAGDAIANLIGGEVLREELPEADGVAIGHAYAGRAQAARQALHEFVPHSAAAYALHVLAKVVLGDADAVGGVVSGSAPLEGAPPSGEGASAVLAFRPPSAEPHLASNVAALVEVAAAAHAGRFTAAAAALDVACGGVDWVRLADPAARALAAHVAAGTDPARAATLTRRTPPRDPEGLGALGANACLGRALIVAGDVAAGRALLVEVWSEAAAVGAHGLCALFAADLLEVVDDALAGLLAATRCADDDLLVPFVHAARAIAAHDPDALVAAAALGTGDTYRTARLELVAASALAHAGRWGDAARLALAAQAAFTALGAPLAQARAAVLAVPATGAV